MTQGMEEYTFSSSGIDLLSFIRDEFADFAIEAYKIEKDRTPMGKDVMKLCILDILSLLHPYTPHITEALYGLVTDDKRLTTQAWPQTQLDVEQESEHIMTIVFDIVWVIRNIRAESKIPPSELRDICIITPEAFKEGIEESGRIITGLGRGSNLNLGTKPQKWSGYAYGVIHGVEIYVDAHIDATKMEEEKSRLSVLIEEKKNYLRSLTVKLQNNAFITQAPEKIVRTEMEKKHQAENELIKLEEKYSTLMSEEWNHPNHGQ